MKRLARKEIIRFLRAGTVLQTVRMTEQMWLRESSCIGCHKNGYSTEESATAACCRVTKDEFRHPVEKRYPVVRPHSRAFAQIRAQGTFLSSFSFWKSL